MAKTTKAKIGKPAAGAAGELAWLAPLAASMAGIGYWHWYGRGGGFSRCWLGWSSVLRSGGNNRSFGH